MTQIIQSLGHRSSGNLRAELRVGFVPLVDCAPLLVARELGLFAKYGLRVSLSRELGWASIRDKIIHRELDAAHALAAMPIAATLGLGCVPCECLTSLVLNIHGNAITLSNDLWRAGVRNASTLREEILRSRGNRTLTFGVVFPYSSHNFLLRGWLSSGGIDPDRDVRIVTVPPPQMAANLKAGHLDGFCVGEPWNSVAVQSRIGWCAAVSAELDAGHPEKVLIVRREFAEKRRAEHLALTAALMEACEFCSSPVKWNEVAAILAARENLNVPASTVLGCLSGEFNFGQGEIRSVRDFVLFHGASVNAPDAEKAAWVMRHLRTTGQCKEASKLTAGLSRRVFRLDLFDEAVRLLSSTEQSIYEKQSKPCLSVA